MLDSVRGKIVWLSLDEELSLWKIPGINRFPAYKYGIQGIYPHLVSQEYRELVDSWHSMDRGCRRSPVYESRIPGIDWFPVNWLHEFDSFHQQTLLTWQYRSPLSASLWADPVLYLSATMKSYRVRLIFWPGSTCRTHGQEVLPIPLMLDTALLM